MLNQRRRRRRCYVNGMQMFCVYWDVCPGVVIITTACHAKALEFFHSSQQLSCKLAMSISAHL